MSDNTVEKIGQLIGDSVLKLLGFAIMGAGGLGIGFVDFFGRMIFAGFVSSLDLKVVGRDALDGLHPSIYTEWSREMIQGSLGDIVTFLGRPIFLLGLVLFVGVIFCLVFHLSFKTRIEKPGNRFMGVYKKGYDWITLGTILIPLIALTRVDNRFFMCLIFLLLISYLAFYIMLNARDLREDEFFNRFVWVFGASSMILAFILFPAAYGTTYGVEAFGDYPLIPLEEFRGERTEIVGRPTFLVRDIGKDPSESPGLVCQYYRGKEENFLRLFLVRESTEFKESSGSPQTLRQVIEKERQDEAD